MDLITGWINKNNVWELQYIQGIKDVISVETWQLTFPVLA